MPFWLVFLLFVCTESHNPEDDFCCSRTSGTCRSACEQVANMAISGDVEQRERKLKVVQNYCSRFQVEFWDCFNKTLQDVRSGQFWSGRRCCPTAHSSICQRACASADSRAHLLFTSRCRQSDELAFFSCLNRMEYGTDCCGVANTPECLDACMNLFLSSRTATKEETEKIVAECSRLSQNVVNCVNNYTKDNPPANVIKYQHCCSKANNERCRESCFKLPLLKPGVEEMVDILQEGGCGPPLPHDELWQCFLQGETNGEKRDSREPARVDVIGMDSAKLHCCSKANTSVCRKLCFKTFSHEWDQGFTDLDRLCLSSPAEHRLQACVDEVEEPCELGCDGLNFCTNWNNRPTELFRSCTAAADDAARHDLALWTAESSLTLPAGFQFPLKNISRCRPGQWKAAACALQIKPCHNHSHSNKICREDCVELLVTCVDWGRLGTDETVWSMCERLSSDDPHTACVSLRPFLEPSDIPYGSQAHSITAPCKGEPCDSREVCVVNRNCAASQPCQSYHCLPGCRLGEASSYTVAQGTFVRVPIHTEQKGCFKICQCTDKLLIEKCQILPCVPFDNCWLGNKKIEHGKTFSSGCNLCNCFAGEITCNKKQCEGINQQDRLLASLPCNCPPHYVPVCGRNGNSYPSACLAKCAGLRDDEFWFGACSSKDPCDGNPCGEYRACVPVRKVCLSRLEFPCLQYVCVDVNGCSRQPRKPVCDTRQKEHPNLCYLLRAGRTLADRGPCKTKCRSDGLVCGVDGETYPSECAAMARHSAVDYRGPCLAVGLVTEEARSMCTPAVACPRLPLPCLGVTPPGACCPICAGALRVLYSRKQVDRTLYALQNASTESLSVEGILDALEKQVAVAECRVIGFLTVERDIFVAVAADREASEWQHTVCVHEAEKLAALLTRGSPRFSSELPLSVLTAATIVHVSVQSCANIFTSSVIVSLLFCIVLKA